MVFPNHSIPRLQKIGHGLTDLLFWGDFESVDEPTEEVPQNYFAARIENFDLHIVKLRPVFDRVVGIDIQRED
jgi:hypothetical protein